MRSRLAAAFSFFAVLTSMTAADSLYLSQEEFMFADNPRHSFLGNTPKRTTSVDLWPTVGMGVAYAGLAVSMHVNQQNAWWRDQTGEFKIIDDIEYARGLDKLGHIWAGYMTSRVSADMLMECGFNYDASTLIGGGLGILYTTYVEVNDGFAQNWGFSPSDAVANVAGVGFYVAQSYVPFLQNFSPRWSYIPPTWSGDADINHRPTTFIDDYNGTTFWLAANVNNMLPSSAAEYWPDWMMISVGYGIRNYAVEVVDQEGNVSFKPVSRRFLIGLDYDWMKIIPESEFGFFNYLRQMLNHIRLPAPTLEIGDDGVAFGLLYPFAIVVPL